ncbi:MAG: hypothetical protein KF887_16990 [Paracoccaceae bacterium]|nr:MAG: hypothetical protein KF887_16990 [Paracoccaceae bacterium]
MERLDQLLDMRPRHPGMQEIQVYHPIQTPAGQAQPVAKRQKASMQVFSYRRRPDRYAQHIFQMRVDAQIISAVIVVQGMGHCPPCQVSVRLEQPRDGLGTAAKKGAHPRKSLVSCPVT